jgi:Ca-activated chloride channel homolog
MIVMARSFRTLAAAATAAIVAVPLAARDGQERPTGQGFSFRTGVELVSVTVTITDDRGRFVPDLKISDFLVYEEGQPQTISQFDSERVPVSLGVALDTSGSMIGEKIVAAQAALNRFLFDLLGAQDEVFLYRFDSRPTLVRGWSEDRRAIAEALGTVRPNGGTAIYDAVAEAVPLAQSGTRRKKALVVISDGNDTSSRTNLADLQQRIRQSEVLIYAIGIDASDGVGTSSSRPTAPSGPASQPNQPRTIPVPSPFPGKAPTTRTVTPPPQPPPSAPPPSSSKRRSSSTDRINADTLRALTDDSGGRTEVIVSPRDLDPATAGIADELSRQYFLGYISTLPKDGRWHTIEVKVRKGNYTIRARKGYIATKGSEVP